MEKYMPKWVLFLDDERKVESTISQEMIDALPYDWYLAHTSTDAIELVKRLGVPHYMFLDHDLGGEDTAKKFLVWLCDNYYQEGPPEWRIHSQNPVGVANLNSFLNAWKESWKKDMAWREPLHEDD